jgi:FKBP-type peptidyl-prolyl cis-trans isomerase
MKTFATVSFCLFLQQQVVTGFQLQPATTIITTKEMHHSPQPLFVSALDDSFSENDYSTSSSSLQHQHHHHHHHIFKSRRSMLQRTITGIAVATGLLLPKRAGAAPTRKCTDIESCRELGEQKVEKDLKENPRVKLDNGVRYKVLRPGTDDAVVKDGSTVDIIYSVSKPGEGYMFSQGFGFEKIDAMGDGKMQSDLGMDSLRIKVGAKDVPICIESALVGMKRGERRRVELPASVGFATSDWKPEPRTNRGKAALDNYRSIVEGRGTNQPPFPAATFWDVEVLRIRS